MRFIGLDSALAHTGYCVLEADALLAYGVITTDSKLSDFERVAALSRGIENLLRVYSVGVVTRAVIEKTDWTRGRRDTRERWIVETSAREALAIGVTTAFCACLNTGITPIVCGPNEWHRALGIHNKAGVAAYVARAFPEIFEIKYVESIRKGKPRGERVVIERKTGKRSPDHVTDAIGMTLVAQCRLELENRIERQETTCSIYQRRQSRH